MFGIITIAGIGKFIYFADIVILLKSNHKWTLEFTETRLLSH